MTDTTPIPTIYSLYPLSAKCYIHNFTAGLVVVIVPEEKNGFEDAREIIDAYKVAEKVCNIGHVVSFCVSDDNEVLVNVKLATGLIEAFHPNHLYRVE